MKNERNSFGGSLAFVLAAAGSAVGLGNIWRFPMLAAKNGGGIFLVVYIVLAVTFGFTLLTTELAIGRKTKQSPLTAYDKIHKGFKPVGILACIVPMMIMPYYCAIGGWVLKYLVVFLTGGSAASAEDGFFGGFISANVQPIVFMAIFLIMTSVAIYRGVNDGIELLSKVLMPILVILVFGVAIFSITISYTDAEGITRTGLEGLKIYLTPNFEGMTLSSFLTVVMDAMGQLFYSLSIAMGIMVAYGSYVKDNDNLSKSVNRIEIFDTLIAFLAGVMILPAVYAFNGKEGMLSAGPGLIFVTLPKIFQNMGVLGTIIGIVFFAMVLFAALTSCISIMEAIVSSIMDQFKVSRAVATTIELVIAGVVGTIVCFGYNIMYFELPLPNGSTAQILDLMDYISNSVLMPIVAISTCILIGWIAKPAYVTDEMTKNGEKFGRAGLYNVMVKFIAPILLLVLFLKSTGIVDFL